MLNTGPAHNRSAVNVAADLGGICNEMIDLIDQQACSPAGVDSNPVKEREEFAGKVRTMNSRLEISALGSGEFLSHSAVSKIQSIGATTHTLLLALKSDSGSETNVATAELRSKVNQLRFDLIKEKGAEDPGLALEHDQGEPFKTSGVVSTSEGDANSADLSLIGTDGSAIESEGSKDLGHISLFPPDSEGSLLTLDDLEVGFDEGDLEILRLDNSDFALDLDTGDSGISLDASDSGIYLDADDSGISLDADDSGISLDGSDSEISLELDDEAGHYVVDENSGIELMPFSEPGSDLGEEIVELGEPESETEISFIEGGEEIIDITHVPAKERRPWYSRLFG